MSKWQYKSLSEFLKERENRFKPDDKTISSYKRLDKIDFSGQIHISEKPSKTDMILIEPGDLVISGINVAKGALAVYEGYEPITATIHYSSYMFNKDKIDINFLKRFLKSPTFISELQKQVKGGIKTEIKAKHLLSLKVRIPELIEQQKINQHFDATENEIAELSNEINTQSTLLTKLREAILQEAIEGKLTAEWRTENPVRKGDPNYDAEALLEKVKAEKEKLIKEGKNKKQKPLPPIKPEEVPFELPDGWVWTRLGELGFVNPRNYIDDNLDTGFSTMPFISSEYGRKPLFEIKKWRLIKSGFTHFADNDVAIAKITPCFENSKACVFYELPNGYGAGTTELHVLRPIKVNPTYIYINLKTRKFLSEGEKLMTGAVGQKRVPVSYFENYNIPLPPLAEQQAIVERVDKLLAIVDELEKQVADRKEKAEQLMQEVLREAFEGGG